MDTLNIDQICQKSTCKEQTPTTAPSSEILPFFYKEFKKDCNFVDSSNAVLPEKFTIHIQRIGNFCQLHIYNKALFSCPNATNFIRLADSNDIPDEFKPVNGLHRVFCGNVVGSANLNGLLEFGLSVPKLLQIFANWPLNNYTPVASPVTQFANTPTNTFYGTVINYNIA